MNIKNSFLPLAVFAATALGGGTYIASKTADNKNNTELTVKNNKQVNEKNVFDYMKHTSVPISDNGMNLAMGLFGIGLAAAKRKEEVLGMIDEIEELARNYGELKDKKEDVLSCCNMLRFRITHDDLGTEDMEIINQFLTELKCIFGDNYDNMKSEEANFIIKSIENKINSDHSIQNDEYRDECIKVLDNVIKGIYATSREGGSYYNSLTTDNEIIKLIGLIENGESDFPELKEQISELLNRQKESLKSLMSTDSEQIAYDMYSRVPRLNWLIQKYTTTEEDWSSGKNSAKYRYPAIENHTHERNDYTQFAANTLRNCQKLKSDLKMNNTSNVGLIVNIIKSEMLNHGTYDNRAFANSMILCDKILEMCNPAGGRFNGSVNELTYYVKMLVENVYTSINNPEHNRPFGTVPNSFAEWEKEIEHIKSGKKPDISKFSKHEQAGNSGYTSITLEKLEEQWRKEEAGNKQVTESEISINSRQGNEEQITFANVGGQDKAIEQLKKKVLYPVKYPNAFKNRMLDRGIIMYGRPGTGKTLVALALSNEADASFIKINASQLTSEFHGKTDQNWRELFTRARQQQPCIIFIDEFDAIGQARGHNSTNTYDDTVIDTILTEMSDIEKNGDNIFVIGATNRFNVLDTGLTRAGRFGTHIELKAPETVKDVLQIFDIHTKDKELAEDVDKTKLAQMMLDKNLTGSDIAKIVNEALENTFLRLGIYERMENGTFNDNDLSDIKTTMDDLVSATENYESVTDKNYEKRPVIGFNKK